MIPGLPSGSEAFLFAVGSAIVVSVGTYLAKVRGPNAEPFDWTKFERTFVIGVLVGVYAFMTGATVDTSTFPALSASVLSYVGGVGGLDQALKGAFRVIGHGVTLPPRGGAPSSSGAPSPSGTSTVNFSNSIVQTHTSAAIAPTSKYTFENPAPAPELTVAGGEGEFTLSWTGPSHVDYYVEDPANGVCVRSVLGAGPSPVTVGGIQPGTWRVAASNADAKPASVGKAKVTVAAPKPDVPPTPPFDFAAEQTSADPPTWTLSWQEPQQHGTNGIAGYTVWRRGSGDTNPTKIATLDKDTTEYTDSPGSGTWSYQVSAVEANTGKNGPMTPEMTLSG